MRLRIGKQLISPVEFLPALGDHQLARRIDFEMVRLAVADLASWHRREIVPEDFRVAVNIGPAAMRSKDLISTIASALDEHAVSPSQLLVEVPETVETVDSETLAALRELGVQIAIDDVGVQFSNLERMVDLQADVAKLDRRWIPSLATAEVSKSEVLRALVDQCTTLDMKIIAEGIETEDQLQMLRELGVEAFQGFLFARPLSLFDFERSWCRSSTASFRGMTGSSPTPEMPSAS